ncbi:TetR/AcrR family transcriptional regulator [Streptomyces sp. TRM 70351]|uniref:TetR/AcrR family transcriptional regulator n=1 Tax=Streptomyces sp. TRM 70351 TaxID=3116552 RepID=UPI002E7BE514|nr:TetR/AcrR family transcriptional regulator [Streptomyces sp. TRM 70351]MEE1931032.1 TetR/AcrR family transcriptional regulator [Streptomyces sp. TRM 70351]
MTPPASGPGTTSRTRRAILDAAVSVLSADRAASLSEIAKAAEVGRSTLHRYFPDRTALVRGLFEEATRATARAVAEAAPDQGTPAEAFRRLVPAMFALGPLVNLLFSETQLGEGDWDEPSWEEAHWPVGALFARGQAAGYFDPEIDADWFIRVLWYVLSAGWQAVAEGALARHEAVARTLRTLEGGLVARGG